MKVLIVRAAQDARRTATRISADGHEAIVAPVLEIRNLDFPAPAGAFDAVVATSGHAFGRPDSLNALVGLPLFVVGARTAESARKAGFDAPRIAAANAEALARAAKGSLRGTDAVYLAGRDRKPDLELALAPICRLNVLETYAAEPAQALPAAAIDALSAGGAVVLHYSQRSAATFLDLARRAGFDRKIGDVRHVAISADAATPLIAAGLPVATAAQPNEDSMIEELARFG